MRDYTADQALHSSHMVSPTTQQTIRDYTADQALQSSLMVSSNEDMENSESIEAIIRTDGLQKSTSPLLGYNTINLFTEAITRNHAKVSSPATQFKPTTEPSLSQRLVVKSEYENHYTKRFLGIHTSYIATVERIFIWSNQTKSNICKFALIKNQS